MPESQPPRRYRPPPPPVPPISAFIGVSPGLVAMCSGCFRQVGLSIRTVVALAGDRENIDGLRRRLRCVECGTRGAGTTIFWPGTSPWNGQYPDFKMPTTERN
jgi:hypothetical protein